MTTGRTASRVECVASRVLDEPEWSPEVARLARAVSHVLDARLPLAVRCQVPLTSVADGSRIGALTVSDAPRLQAVVTVTIAHEALSLCTAVAFSPPRSALPHLSFEAVTGRGHTWASVDLMPRVPLTEDPDYVAEVYEPLSGLRWSMDEVAGFRHSQMRSRHRMVMSPWLFTFEVLPDGLDAAASTTSAYVGHFADVVVGGLGRGGAGLTPDEHEARDRRERARLYSWDTTANYRFIELLCGADTVDLVQGAFRDPDSVPGSPAQA